jgi:hypothetical protein
MATHALALYARNVPDCIVRLMESPPVIASRVFMEASAPSSRRV